MRFLFHSLVHAFQIRAFDPTLPRFFDRSEAWKVLISHLFGVLPFVTLKDHYFNVPFLSDELNFNAVCTVVVLGIIAFLTTIDRHAHT